MAKGWRRDSFPSLAAREAPWEIRLCGRVMIGATDGVARPALPGRQGQLLFAYLVCHRTRACPRYELEDVLWPKDAPASSESALSALLSKLRRALGPDRLTGRAELRLALPEPLWVDIEALADGVEVAAQALEDRRWEDATGHARAALALGAEPFLAECDGPWVRERRREVEGLRLRALEALGEAGLRLGGRELDAAEHAARTAIGLAPFRESSHRLLMEVHEAAGNPAEALRAFDELRQRLRDELGTAPGPAVMGVHQRLLRGDGPPADPATPVLGPAPGPLPAGLAAATAKHAFVGRADALATLRGAWDAAVGDERRLVLLAGERGDREVAAGGGVHPRGAPRGRGRALRALRRDRAGRLPAGARDAAGLVRRGRADRAGAAARPARRRPRRAAAGARRARGPVGHPRRARAPAAVRRAGGAARASSRPARRSCSCSTTCSGPTARRSSCCAT